MVGGSAGGEEVFAHPADLTGDGAHQGPAGLVALDEDGRAAGQHGEKNVADRGKAFGIQTKTIDGNDAVNAYNELKAAMEYVRKERKPFLMEAMVSRLYGHSSASGANMVGNEQDCLTTFEQRLEKHGILTRKEMDELRNRYTEDMAAMARQVIQEPMPGPETIWNHIYAERK